MYTLLNRTLHLACRQMYSSPSNAVSDGSKALAHVRPCFGGGCFPRNLFGGVPVAPASGRLRASPPGAPVSCRLPALLPSCWPADMACVFTFAAFSALGVSPSLRPLLCVHEV